MMTSFGQYSREMSFDQSAGFSFINCLVFLRGPKDQKNEHLTVNPTTTEMKKNVSINKSVMSFLRNNQMCEADERIFKDEALGCFMVTDLRLNSRVSN